MVRSVIMLFAFVAIGGYSRALAQATEKEQKATAEAIEIKNLIESKRYKFVAQSMMPQTGSTRAITTPYDLSLRQDTLSADLPYVGRAFSVEYGSTDNALNFKTTSFSYTKSDSKKGGWEIVIVPKSNRNVSKMILKISDTGFTNLSVQSNTRQSISYSGYIRSLEF